MSSSNLFRWSGMAALIGGVMFIVLGVIESGLLGNTSDPETVGSSTWIIVEGLFFLMAVLVTLGLTGLYLYQAQQSGMLGLIAFLLAFTGSVMASATIWSGAFIGSWLAEAAPELLGTEPSGAFTASFLFAYGLFALGWLLFGFASLQAKVLPRGPAMLLMIGSLLFLVFSFLEIPFIEITLFGAAVAWMGYALWSGADEPQVIAAAAN